jgi:hypothetical protein
MAAGRKIDNGEPPVTEGHRVIVESANVVRTAVRHRRDHRLDSGGIRLSKDTGNPAQAGEPLRATYLGRTLITAP